MKQIGISSLVGISDASAAPSPAEGEGRPSRRCLGAASEELELELELAELSQLAGLDCFGAAAQHPLRTKTTVTVIRALILHLESLVIIIGPRLSHLLGGPLAGEEE